jgi:hypothetical protein
VDLETVGSSPTGHPTKKSAVLNSGLFILAGYYTDYSQVRTNDKGSIYVSEEFKNKAAISTGKVVMVSFEDTGDIQKECDRLWIEKRVFKNYIQEGLP